MTYRKKEFESGIAFNSGRSRVETVVTTLQGDHEQYEAASRLEMLPYPEKVQWYSILRDIILHRAVEVLF